jgi:hypothetical protein
MNHAGPNLSTHIAVKQELPKESNVLAVGRPDLPVPSLWQKGVGVTHKVSNKRAVIAAVDHAMCLFRAYYPDETGTALDAEGNTVETEGRFAPRTEWESFANWIPDVTLSPEELERQAARAKWQEEINKLEPDDLEVVAAFIDESGDPTKMIAKLEVLRRKGLIKPAAIAAVVEAKGSKK